MFRAVLCLGGELVAGTKSTTGGGGGGIPELIPRCQNHGDFAL